MRLRTLLVGIAMLVACKSDKPRADESRAVRPATPVTESSTESSIDCAALVTDAELADACGAGLTWRTPAREGAGQNVCDREAGTPDRLVRLIVSRARDLDAAAVQSKNAPAGGVRITEVHPTSSFRVLEASARRRTIVLAARSQVRGGGPGHCTSAQLERLATLALGRL